jgi:hypothetical protein
MGKEQGEDPRGHGEDFPAEEVVKDPEAFYWASAR